MPCCIGLAAFLRRSAKPYDPGWQWLAFSTGSSSADRALLSLPAPHLRSGCQGTYFTAFAVLRAGGEPLQVGSRTECALLALAAGLGEDYAAARERHRQAAVAPFSSERKRMSTLAAPADPRWVVTRPSWHAPVGVCLRCCCVMCQRAVSPGCAPGRESVRAQRQRLVRRAAVLQGRSRDRAAAVHATAAAGRPHGRAAHRGEAGAAGELLCGWQQVSLHSQLLGSVPIMGWQTALNLRLGWGR